GVACGPDPVLMFMPFRKAAGYLYSHRVLPEAGSSANTTSLSPSRYIVKRRWPSTTTLVLPYGSECFQRTRGPASGQPAAIARPATLKSRFGPAHCPHSGESAAGRQSEVRQRRRAERMTDSQNSAQRPRSLQLGDRLVAHALFSCVPIATRA